MAASTYLIAAVRPYRLRIMNLNMNINIHEGFEPDRGMGKLSTGGIGPGATSAAEKETTKSLGDLHTQETRANNPRDAAMRRCGEPD